MKKIILVSIIVLGISFVLTGCFEVTPANSGDKEPEIVLENTFRGYSIEEWEQMIEEYFFEGEYEGKKIEATCKYDDNGNFTADVSTDSLVMMSFIFDDKTGYAKDDVYGLEMDFVKGKCVNLIKNQSDLFTDNICLGVASITDENEDATIEKYCNGRLQYDILEKIDYSVPTEYVDKFLIIPKDDSVTFDICTCKITDEGNVEPDEVLKYDINEPVVLCYDDYESIMPRYGLRLKSNGFEDFITISFSGYDGSLNLVGNKLETIDLTIYE